MGDAQRLQAITLGAYDYKPEEIARLGSLRHLKYFLFYDHSHLTDQHLKAIQSLSELTWLGIGTQQLSNINDSHVAEMLEHLPELSSIQTRKIGLDGSCFENAKLPNISRIGFAGFEIGIDEQRPKVTVASIENVKRFPNLQDLTFRFAKLSKDHLLALSQLASLKKLDLSEATGIESHLDTLVESKSLNTLTLINTKLSDSDIESLGAIKTLVKLDLRTHEPTSRSEEAIKRLRTALPSCEILTGVVGDN